MIVAFHGEVASTDFIGIVRGDTHEEVAKEVLKQISDSYKGEEILRFFTFEEEETTETGYPDSTAIDDILFNLVEEYNRALQ